MVDISEKSKKNEILDAYNELLRRVQGTKEVSHQETLLQQQNDDVVVKATQFDVEHIVTTLGQVKVMVTQSLGHLEKNLTAEYNHLSNLQQAIKIETKSLEDLHQIKKNADSLAALLLAQKERKAAFDAEIEERKDAFEQERNSKRLEWALEKERYDQTTTERAATLKKERMRDEEEYRYTTTLERKKERDTYETNKEALERDLQERQKSFEQSYAQREAAITTAEHELTTLRARVEQFPNELTQAVTSAEKAVRTALEREHLYAVGLKTAEIDGEKRLQQQTISSLQARIKEQEALIRDLGNKSEVATQQVQTIALRALEGATGATRVIEREEVKAAQRQI